MWFDRYGGVVTPLHLAKKVSAYDNSNSSKTNN
jgi:hypothetical protein